MGRRKSRNMSKIPEEGEECKSCSKLVANTNATIKSKSGDSRSSSSDEDDDFVGFSSDDNESFNENKLSCYECGNDFAVTTVNIDKAAYYGIQEMNKIGMRWHCPTCLKSPYEIKSLKLDMNDFKLSMKRELISITERLNNQLECFQASMESKVENQHTKQVVKPPSMVNSTVTDRVTHQVIVQTDKDNPFTPTTLAERIKNNLSKIPVQKIQVNKSGQGVINFPSESSRDNGFEQLKDQFKVEPKNQPRRSLLPKITIRDIISNDYASTDSEKLKQSIRDKNPAINGLIEQGKVFQILFIKKDLRRDNFSIAVVRLDEEIRKVIMSMKCQLFIDFSRCRVSDRLHVTQCYKCQKFGHVKEDCTSKTSTCKYCSEDHDWKSCPHNGNFSKYKCGNCSHNHSSTYAGCTVLQNQVMSLAHRTQGMESFSKNDISRHVIST